MPPAPPPGHSSLPLWPSPPPTGLSQVLAAIHVPFIRRVVLPAPNSEASKDKSELPPKCSGSGNTENFPSHAIGDSQRLLARPCRENGTFLPHLWRELAILNRVVIIKRGSIGRRCGARGLRLRRLATPPIGHDGHLHVMRQANDLPQKVAAQETRPRPLARARQVNLGDAV